MLNFRQKLRIIMSWVAFGTKIILRLSLNEKPNAKRMLSHSNKIILQL